MSVKKILAISLLCCLFIKPALADNNFEPLLNKVTLDFSAEKWVTTKTALVNVGINLSLSDRDMGKVQSGILNQLNKIANKTEWHIISFNRTLDQSGLEKVQAEASARLSESDLAGLRDRAKELSKPGQTFAINDIQFTSSEQEQRDALVALRNDIYQQIKVELTKINQLYPEQKYSVHDIRFFNQPSPLGIARNAVFMAQAKAVSPADMLPVGDQLKLNATVVLSAAPDQDVMNLVHGK